LFSISLFQLFNTSILSNSGILRYYMQSDNNCLFSKFK